MEAAARYEYMDVVTAGKSPIACLLGQHIPARLSTVIFSVEQLTDGFRYIRVWQRSAFTSAFPSGEQKKLNGLTLYSLL
jgi:hypothetical protein